MVDVIGEFKSPKPMILKVNSVISLSNLASHTLKMVLLKQDVVFDPLTIDKFTGDITAYEQDYSGYERKTLSNVTRVDNISDRYLWIADDVTFESLYATVRYGLIIDDTTKDVISVMDLGDNLTFAGDITFDLNVHGFFGIKV